MSVNKVSILNDGSATCSEPCRNYLQIKEQISTTTSVVSARDCRGDNVFRKTPNDDQVGLSVEDRKFVKLMNNSFRNDEDGFWTALCLSNKYQITYLTTRHKHTTVLKFYRPAFKRILGKKNSF